MSAEHVADGGQLLIRRQRQVQPADSVMVIGVPGEVSQREILGFQYAQSSVSQVGCRLRVPVGPSQSSASIGDGRDNNVAIHVERLVRRSIEAPSR